MRWGTPMPDFLALAAALVLLMVAVGLVRILRGPTDADRMMAAQLLGTGGVAALLLVGTIASAPGAIDVALVLAVLAAFAALVLVRSQGGPDDAG